MTDFIGELLAGLFGGAFPRLVNALVGLLMGLSGLVFLGLTGYLVFQATVGEFGVTVLPIAAICLGLSAICLRLALKAVRAREPSQVAGGDPAHRE